MKAIKHRLLYLAFIAFVLASYFSILILIDSFKIPAILRLAPGQAMTLKVRYPLSFYGYGQISKTELPIQSKHNFSTTKLTLNTLAKGRSIVQLRLFGKIPVKEMQVEIVPSPQVIPGGQAIGVLFSNRGVVIVGLLPLRGMDQKQHFPSKEAGLHVGDVILAINNIPVNRVDEVEIFLQNFKAEEKILILTVKRFEKISSIQIQPILSNSPDQESPQRYRLGIYIEDPAAGVGTLSFYDPATMRFAGLGHRIAEFAGKKEIVFRAGAIVLASIQGIKPGSPGQPGEKIGVFHSEASIIGKIDKNCRFGIYGVLNNNFTDNPNMKPLSVAYSSEVQVGPAEIYTVIKGHEIGQYHVRIIKVFRQDNPRDKGMIIKVTDPILLKETGGIIQGMSGSPIIQGGKLVGAVTHVFVNDPTKGYGVLAEWMINEMSSVIAVKIKAS